MIARLLGCSLLVAALISSAHAGTGEGCSTLGEFGPGPDLAENPVGLFYLIAGPPSGHVLGARAEVTVNAPFGEDAANWAISFVGLNLVTPLGPGGGWAFSAADFGWSGPGEFTGTLFNPALTGQIITESGLSSWEAQVQPVTDFFTGKMQLEIHILLELTDDYPGDLDGDLFVGLSDLGILLASFAVDDGGDLDCDGDTDLADLGVLLARFGTCAPLIC
jgi:hypothetical protein